MPLKLTKRAGSPVWYVRGTIRGDRYYESTGTGPRQHAEAFRQAREREILDRTYLGEGRTTLFSEAALEYMTKGGEKRFLEPLIQRWGATRVVDLKASDVSRAARDLFPNAKPATIKRSLYVPLNAVLNAAARAQMIPVMRFEAPKVKRQPVQYADQRWLEQFFPQAHFPIAAMVLFLTLTGARVTEACRLAPADIDLDRAEAILRLTKSGRSRRIPLAPVLVETLRRAIAECAKEIDGEPRVFGYAARWSVNQAIERVCKRAGLVYLSSHKVGRHAAAARMLASGASLRTVQEAIGWAQIRMVAENYGHLEQQATDATMRSMGDGMPALPPTKGKT